MFYVIPKVMGGLHPNTGDQGSALVDMSPAFYAVFWPAVFGFVCTAIWLLDLRGRTAVATHQLNTLEDE